MKDNAWGKEPFDLRLTFLRMIRELPWILVTTALVTIVLGGGYYLKNVTFRQRVYEASTTCNVEYADPNWYQNTKYLNEYTWGLWVQTSEFAEGIVKRLPAGTVAAEELVQTLRAELPSDLRMVRVCYSSTDENKANLVNGAIGATMEEDIAAIHPDIAAIRVVDVKKGAENLKTIKPVRAFVLAAVIGLFAGVILFLLKELLFERIWLPETLTNRYGLKNAGIPGTEVYGKNLEYFFEDKKRVAVCPAENDADPKEFVDALSKYEALKKMQWVAMPYPVMAPDSAGTLREMDGVLLFVRAGEDVKSFERTLEFLEAQDCKVTAAALWEEDAWLLKWYYRWNPRR